MSVYSRVELYYGIRRTARTAETFRRWGTIDVERRSVVMITIIASPGHTSALVEMFLDSKTDDTSYVCVIY